MTTWEIQARELANCNGSYGCPCQPIVDTNASAAQRFVVISLNIHNRL